MIDPVLVQSVFQVIHHIGVCFLFQYRFLIIGFKRLSNIFGGVDEVQNKSVLLAPHSAVQAGKGLDGLHAGQFFVHKHGVQQRLVEAGLILFRHDQHPIFIRMERLRQSLLFDGLAGFCFVQLLLGVGFSVVLHLAGKGHQHIQVSIALLLDLPLELQQVAHRMEPGGRHDHGLGLAADLVPGYAAELLQHDSRFLGDIVGVQRLKLANRTHTRGGIQLWIVRDGLGNLVIHVVGHVILQHVQDKAFLNGLPHGIHMEGMIFTILIPLTEHLQRFVLRGCGKREEGQVFMDTLGGQFIQQLVLIVFPLGFLLVLLFGVLFQNFLGIGQRPLQLAGGVAGLGRMGLVHNDSKPLIAGAHFFVDDRELLESGNDDPRPGLDGLPELLGVLVDFLHHARHMVELIDGVLQLAVQHPAVGDDDDGLEDFLVVVIMQAGEPVGQPGNGVGLAGTGAVLNEIVLAGAVDLYIGQQLCHHVQLVISGEDHPLGLHLAGLFVLLLLQVEVFM